MGPRAGSTATLGGVTRPTRPADRGWFITIEGPEGAGKTTQAARLEAHLRDDGIAVVRTREPGGTSLGERIRDLLLAGGPPAGDAIDPLADALLFNAARRQLVEEVIRPALEAGTTVVCARFADSTLAYQGYGAGVPLADLRDARGDRDRRPPAGPDDPPRPAGRGRPRPQGARRPDPLRARVRPRLPSPRPRRVSSPSPPRSRRVSRSSTRRTARPTSGTACGEPLAGCTRNRTRAGEPDQPGRTHTAMNDRTDRVSGRVASPADDADRAVLLRVADGQLDALQDLYDTYRTMAYSIALRITADASLAEDVVQDAFLGAWRNAARYVEGKGSVKTWLLSIVHHRAVDAVRRRRPTVELPEREDVPPASLTLPDIWQEVAGNLDREEIAAALGSLSDVQREAIELAYFGGLTQQEIAARTGTPLGTVKSRIRLGLLAMRRALVGDDGPIPRSGRAMSMQPMTHEQASTSRRPTSSGRSRQPRMAAVREHLATCPESHAEFERARRRRAVPRSSRPTSSSSSRPRRSRDRIMAAAAADLARAATRGLAPAASPRMRRRSPFPSATEREAARPEPDRAARLGDADRGRRRDRRPGRLEPAPAERRSRCRARGSIRRSPR